MINIIMARNVNLNISFTSILSPLNFHIFERHFHIMVGMNRYKKDVATDATNYIFFIDTFRLLRSFARLREHYSIQEHRML